VSDITFTRGYGFPKGSAMDYAGYAGLRRGGFGMLVNTRRRQMRGYAAIPSLPEPSIFEKIPALDGLGEGGGEFGSEYVFTRDRAALGRYGEGGTLPTYHAETDSWTTVDGSTVPYGPSAPPGCTTDSAGRTVCPGSAGSGGGVSGFANPIAVLFGLGLAYYFFKG
jgi:hypothetical protein